MPIRRIPIVHKFGIISQTQRFDLQERLARRVLEENTKSESAYVRDRSLPYEIDEDFPEEFNSSESPGKEELEEKAKNILLRAKRKAGLRDGGIGGHVNLQQAWRDLSLLALCESRSIQEDSLEALCQSLDQAPISKNHVISLFDLARHCVVWLTGVAMNQPYLRTGELIIVKIAHLVFLRLYYHYLAGDIQGCYLKGKEFFDLLQDLSDKDNVYRPYPTVILTIRLVIKVSSCLESILKQELKELNEGKISVEVDSTQQIGQHSKDGSSDTVIPKPQDTSEVILDRTNPELLQEKSTLEVQNLKGQETEDPTEDQEPVFHELKCPVEINKDPSFVPSIHDSCPVLWHSLDIWRTVSRTGIRLADAVDGLLSCSEDFDPENWLDSMIAILVMSEAAKINNTILATFQTLARQGIIKSVQTNNERQKRRWRDKLKGSYSPDEVSSNDQDENDIASSSNILQQLREFLSPQPIRDRSDHNQYPPPTGETQDARVSPTPNLVSLNLESRKKGNSSNLAGCKKTQSRVDIDGCQIRQSPSFSPRNMEEEIDNVDLANSCDTSGGSLADVSSLESTDIVGIAEHDPVRQTQDTVRQTQDTSRQHEARHNASRKHRRKRHDKSYRSIDSESSTEDMPLQGEKHKTTRKRYSRGNNTSKDNLEQNQLKEQMERDYVTRESTISLGQLAGAIEEPSGSSCTTKTITAPPSRADGSKGWTWQLIVTYVQCLGQICLHGHTSVIQRDALVGSSGVGLTQLLKFHLPNTEQSPNRDWSWRIRHVTVQELVKICSYYRHDALKEGLRNSAWTSLLSHHSSERDTRVLEAYKIARSEIQAMDYQFVKNTSQPSLQSRISTNLAIIHLPPLVSPVKQPIVSHSKKSSPRRQVHHKSETNKTVPRISINDEIMLATALDSKPVNYKNRAWKTVQEVVEDQWRKELLEENEEIEKERLQQLERKMTQIAENVIKEPLRQRIL